MFVNDSMGALVDISGLQSDGGRWEHKAFVPSPLPAEMPELSSNTMLAVANARAALASLDSTAAQLPNPTLLRMPTRRRVEPNIMTRSSELVRAVTGTRTSTSLPEG